MWQRTKSTGIQLGAHIDGTHMTNSMLVDVKKVTQMHLHMSKPSCTTL